MVSRALKQMSQERTLEEILSFFGVLVLQTFLLCHGPQLVKATVIKTRLCSHMLARCSTAEPYAQSPSLIRQKNYWKGCGIKIL